MLSLGGLYALFVVASVVRRVLMSNQRNDPPERSLCRLQAQIANLRQVIDGLFFTFGAVFFWTLPNAFITIGDGTGPQINEYVENFRFHFVYAANVFSALLLLHCIQWGLSRRVRHREVNSGK